MWVQLVTCRPWGLRERFLPLDRNTRLGPLVSKSQYERVMSYLDLARDEGRILLDGRCRSRGTVRLVRKCLGGDTYTNNSVVFDVGDSLVEHRVVQRQIQS